MTQKQSTDAPVEYSLAEAEAWAHGYNAALQHTNWQPIETAPMGEYLLLYFPPDTRGNLMPMIRFEHHPVHFPRKPTMWARTPAMPAEARQRTRPRR